MQKKLFDISWSDESECQACHKAEGTETQASRYEVRQWKQKAKTSEKEWKWQRAIVTHPLSESQWNREHFKGHVATGGTLLGAVGSCDEE